MMHCVYRSLLVLASWPGILFFTTPASAQQTTVTNAQQTSVPTAVAAGSSFTDATQKTLSADEVMQLVRRFHPVAKQAGIQVQQAKAKLLAARGGFDPFSRLDHRDYLTARVHCLHIFHTSIFFLDFCCTSSTLPKKDQCILNGTMLNRNHTE